MSKAQDEINEYFKEAAELGESEYIVVGLQYTEDEAIEKMKALIVMMVGEEGYDYYDLPNISQYPIGRMKDEDGEEGFGITFITDEQEGAAWGVAQI